MKKESQKQKIQWLHRLKFWTWNWRKILNPLNWLKLLLSLISRGVANLHDWLNWTLGKKLASTIVFICVVLLALGYKIGEEFHWWNFSKYGLSEYTNNPAEIFRNIIWAFGLVFGGAFALLGFVNALHKTRQKDQELNTDRERLKSTQVSERRRTDADIFAKSVEQLGHEKMAIRLGGLYAIESLARSAKLQSLEDDDNKTYLNSLLETLAAFVRMQAPILNSEHELYDNSINTDVEVAIRIISRTFTYETRKRFTYHLVDLRNCNLRMLEMPYHSDLQKFDFSHSTLSKAQIRYAKFQGSFFIETTFRETFLERSNFDNCNFESVALIETNMEGASLKSAYFDHSSFVYTILTNADLSYASLLECTFKTPILTEAILNNTDFIGTDIDLRRFKSEIADCLWDPKTPPKINAISDSAKAQQIIATRTKAITKGKLW